MVKMAKNQKKRAVLKINSTKCMAYISWSFFSNWLRAGITVVGEKSPTSPAFGSGWDTTFIRVKFPFVVAAIHLA